MKKNRQRGSGGFTLVELMIVVAIVAVLQTLAVPALSEVTSSMRLTAAVNSLFSSLHLARSEAVKRNSRVVVCKSANGNTCASTGGWEQGWIVFHDANNNSMLDAGEVRLSSEAGLPHPLRITGNSQLARYVSYTSTGTTKLTSGAFQAGTLTVCPQSLGRVEARQLVISSTGRPRTLKAMVDQCP